MGASAPAEQAQNGPVEHMRVSCSAHAVLGGSEPPRCPGALPNTLVSPHDPCTEVLVHRQWLPSEVLSSSQDTGPQTSCQRRAAHAAKLWHMFSLQLWTRLWDSQITRMRELILFHVKLQVGDIYRSIGQPQPFSLSYTLQEPASSEQSLAAQRMQSPLPAVLPHSGPGKAYPSEQAPTDTHASVPAAAAQPCSTSLPLSSQRQLALPSDQARICLPASVPATAAVQCSGALPPSSRPHSELQAPAPISIQMCGDPAPDASQVAGMPHMAGRKQDAEDSTWRSLHAGGDSCGFSSLFSMAATCDGFASNSAMPARLAGMQHADLGNRSSSSLGVKRAKEDCSLESASKFCLPALRALPPLHRQAEEATRATVVAVRTHHTQAASDDYAASGEGAGASAHRIRGDLSAAVPDSTCKQALHGAQMIKAGSPGTEPHAQSLPRAALPSGAETEGANTRQAEGSRDSSLLCADSMSGQRAPLQSAEADPDASSREEPLSFAGLFSQSDKHKQPSRLGKKSATVCSSSEDLWCMHCLTGSGSTSSAWCACAPSQRSGMPDRAQMTHL